MSSSTKSLPAVEMAGAATLQGHIGTWGQVLDTQKSALRWDIKRTMKSLCQKLTEIGEECFVVTANLHNGWVGQMGSIRGVEYLEDRDRIPWDFLQFCSDSSHVVESLDSSEPGSDGEPNSDPAGGNNGSTDEDSSSHTRIEAGLPLTDTIIPTVVNESNHIQIDTTFQLTNMCAPYMDSGSHCVQMEQCIPTAATSGGPPNLEPDNGIIQENNEATISEAAAVCASSGGPQCGTGGMGHKQNVYWMKTQPSLRATRPSLRATWPSPRATRPSLRPPVIFQGRVTRAGRRKLTLRPLYPMVKNTVCNVCHATYKHRKLYLEHLKSEEHVKLSRLLNSSIQPQSHSKCLSNS